MAWGGLMSTPLGARARDTHGSVCRIFQKLFFKRVDKSKKICYNTYTNKKGM